MSRVALTLNTYNLGSFFSFLEGRFEGALPESCKPCACPLSALLDGPAEEADDSWSPTATTDSRKVSGWEVTTFEPWLFVVLSFSEWRCFSSRAWRHFSRVSMEPFGCISFSRSGVPGSWSCAAIEPSGWSCRQCQCQDETKTCEVQFGLGKPNKTPLVVFKRYLGFPLTDCFCFNIFCLQTTPLATTFQLKEETLPYVWQTWNTVLAHGLSLQSDSKSNRTATQWPCPKR